MNDEFATTYPPATEPELTPYADLVNTIVTGVVAHPDDVEVTAERQGRTILVEVGVAQEDMGKIIGKGGRNIDSIRSVVRAAGLRQHERVQVELLEDEEDDDELPQVDQV